MTDGREHGSFAEDGPRFLAPLYSFTMEGDRVELEPGLAIVKVRNDLWADMAAQRWPALPAGPWYYAIELVAPGDTGMEHVGRLDRAREMFDQVVRALRLLKRGFFACPAVYSSPLPSRDAESVGLSVVSPAMPTLRDGRYSLKACDTARLKELHSECRGFDSLLSMVQLAVRRLDAASERARADDRLIDAITGLEALLLGDDAELALRLALRAAWLLGEDVDSRGRVFAILKKAYTRRSKLVHGSKEPPAEVMVDRCGFSAKFTPHEFAGQVEDILRMCIIRLLTAKTKKDIENLHAALDDSAATGERCFADWETPAPPER